MTELKCPYCEYEDEECQFPDLFYTDITNTKEINEQYELLLELNTHGFNIVTCGTCGRVFIQKLYREKDI